MSILSIYKDLLFMQGYLTDHRFFDPPEAEPAQDAKPVVPKPILSSTSLSSTSLAGMSQTAACCSPGAMSACS